MKRLIGLVGALSVAMVVATSGVASAAGSVVHYWGDPTDSYNVPNVSSDSIGGPVTQVATANSAWYALRNDGTVEAWGNDEWGQLGNGSRTSTLSPVKVRFPKGVKIAYLANTGPQGGMLALDTNGEAWAWGYNKWGELCTGDTAPHLRPVPIPLPGRVTALAGAGDHVLIVVGGTLYACGNNGDGDLGIGNTTPAVTPAVVPLSNVISVYASWRNSGAVLSDGSLYSWGYGALGEVGNGSTADADSPVEIPLPAPVQSVAWGGSLKNNGQVLALAGDTMYAWGSDRYAQLGDGTTRFSVDSPEVVATPVTYVKVETGGQTSYGLDANGNLYGWGDDHHDQLGDGGGSGTVTSALLLDTGVGSMSATAYVVDDQALPRA